MTDRTDRSTDHHDDRLARVLADEAGDHRPVPDWDDVVDRAANARAGRRWIPTAAAALVVALLAAVAVALSGGDDDAGVVAEDPDVPAVEDRSPGSTTTSTEPADSPPTTSVAGAVSDGPSVGPLDLPAGAPLAEDEIVATVIDPESEFGSIAIVVLSTETGEVIRTVAEGYDSVEGGVYGLSMSPDRRTVFFVLGTTACTDEVHAVAADGSGKPSLVVPNASRVAVSPDGKWLAADIGGPCDETLDVDLVSLDGGTVRRYSVAGKRAVESLAFSGDATVVLADHSAFDGDDPLLRSVDFDTGTVEIVPAPVDGASYSRLHGTADGRFTALESCCGNTGTDVTELVTFDDTGVVDREAVEVGGDLRFVRTIGLTSVGDVVVVGDDGRLQIDGRVVREDVGGVALG